MIGLHTPREVIEAVKAQRNAPWWARRHGDRIAALLAKTIMNGRSVLDTPMSAAAVDAVIEEARLWVKEPDPRDPVGEMLYDMAPKGSA